MTTPPVSPQEAHAQTESPSSFDDVLKQVARTPDERAADVPGVSFVGRFEIIRLLGRGGFGVVYQARDTELGRHVAVKLVRPEHLEERAPADRAWLLEVFHREAEAAARLNHPNIITIYDYGTHEGVPYLVLELLVGETLARRIERAAVPQPDAVAILAQICRGLQHAHAAGVIHRDLKPGNVFLREDGQVKILDFGLAHVAEALTGAGQAPAGGTPGYMAPEQRRGEAGDERTDVFACGVILHEMLCRRVPIDGERMVGLPVDLVAIAERSLAADPADRFPSAQELLDALLRVSQRGGAALPDEPYRYLEQFTEADAPWFFGREREVARLAQMLAARPFVALVGPSGAGKSSLVHAGLIPRLRREQKWTVVVLRPGGEPLQRLHERLVEVCTEEKVTRLLPDADALIEAPGRAGRLLRAHARESNVPILLVVDQLEELVTQVNTAAVRRAFAEALLSLGDDAAGPIRVVATVRGDFLGKLTRNAELSEALAKNMVLLGPPDAAALAETLRSPAALLGYEHEPGLVDEMVAAVADEPAPLPLLQLAASRLWERRDATRRRLSRAALAAAGGVAGILAAHANQVLDGLAGRDEVTIARRILCDLVTDEGTRRRVRREEILGRFDEPEGAGRVLERLVSGRLVTSYRAERGEWVELAHESLIAGWSLLQGWLDEDRVDRQFRGRLLAAATLWQERKQPRELLWRGETLHEGLRWRQRYPGLLSRAEHEFLMRSAARARRARRTRRGLLAAAAVVAVAGTLTSIVTVRAYRAAAREARLREIVRKAAAAEDPLIGALLLAEFEGQPEPAAGVAAAVHVAARPVPLVVYRGHESLVTPWISKRQTSPFSPDGKWVVTGDSAGDVHVWRSDGEGRAIVLRGHRAGIVTASFSPDGEHVLSTSDDDTARIWRADGTGAPVVLPDCMWVAHFTPDGAHVAVGRASDEGGVFLRIWRADGRGEPVVFRHDERVADWELNSDATSVVAVTGNGVGLWRADGTRVVFWPWTGLVQAGAGRRRGLATFARFSSDGSRIMTGNDDAIRVWRADLSAPVVLPEALKAIFSPDGRILQLTKQGLSIISADGATRTDLGPVLEDTQGFTFSVDGSRVISFGDVARLWRADGTGESIALQGHSSPVRGAAFNRDGTRVLTISEAGPPRIWAVGSPPGARDFLGHVRGVWSVTVSPDGRLLLTAAQDGTARLWPVGGGAPVVLGKVGGPAFNHAVFSPDGTRVATADDESVRVWSVSGEPLAVPVPRGMDSVVFSPDGDLLAAAGHPWDVVVARPDGAAIARLEVGDAVTVRRSIGARSVAFSHDGTRLVASIGGRAAVWRSDDWAAQPVVLQGVPGLALHHSVFHPRGSMILTGSTKYVHLFSLDGHELVGLRRPGGETVAFSPDGDLIATGRSDGTARVSRLDLSGETIVLRGHRSGVNSVVFHPDGRRLATASRDGTARLWLLDWGDLVHSLRAATTACLTVDERMTDLDEPAETARAAWEACERRHGRTP